MKTILPVMVNTWEALMASAKDGVTVIHVDNSLYWGNPALTEQKLAEFSYVPRKQHGKRGVFFLLTQGPYRFDPKHHKIHDPLNIL